jgi:hypothetical protein
MFQWTLTRGSDNMAYWVLIPEEKYKNKMQCKVIKQITQPKADSARTLNYPRVEGFKQKQQVAAYLNELGIKNVYRPLGFKTYDARGKTLNKNEKIIYDVLINDINVVDAIHIVSQYAALTTIRVNGEKHTGEIQELMKQKRTRKSKDYPDEDYQENADLMIRLKKDDIKLKKVKDISSPITVGEFAEAFDKRMQEMKDD